MNNEEKVINSILLLSKAVKTIREGLKYEIGYHTSTGEKIDRLLKEFDDSFAGLLLKVRSSKRRRSSPKGGQSNVRKADVARRAKRRTE